MCVLMLSTYSWISAVIPVVSIVLITGGSITLTGGSMTLTGGSTTLTGIESLAVHEILILNCLKTVLHEDVATQKD